MLPILVDTYAAADSPNWDGQRVRVVDGDPGSGKQGRQRRTYEVLTYCNELLRYGAPLHK